MSAGGAGPLVQYWHEAEPPGDVAELVAGFGRLNPDLDHRVYDRKRAAELIGERFGGRELAAFRACRVPAMQADYFRYCAIHALGGVYADVDFRCRAPLRPLLARTTGGTLFGRPELPPRWRRPELEWRERCGPYRVIANSIFAFPAPGHPLPGLALALASAAIERRIEGEIWLVTGPAIFTSLYLLNELGSLDALERYLAGGALAPLAPLLRELVDAERVAAAFAGVETASMATAHEYVEDERRLSYKQGEGDWANIGPGVYG